MTPSRDSRSSLGAGLSVVGLVVTVVLVTVILVVSCQERAERAEPVGSRSVSEASAALVARGLALTSQVAGAPYGSGELDFRDFSLHTCRGHERMAVFSVHVNFQLAVAEGADAATLAAIREYWQSLGYEERSYHSGGVEARDPERFRYAAHLNSPRTAFRLSIITPCYENPDPGSLLYYVDLPPGWEVRSPLAPLVG